MTEILYVRHGRLHYFVREALKRLRLPATHASKVGDVLVAADLAGFEGEGVRRLPHFASLLSTGLITANANIQVTHQEEATATIAGDNGMGHVIAARAMETAIDLARRFGVGAVSVRNSNDLGMAGYYARMALEEQMVGIVMSNADLAMVPTFGKAALIGENPIAIAIPTAEDLPPFVLDIATSATSRQKLEDAIRHGEAIPPGVALDESGAETTDPKAALQAMRLLPLGGTPQTGSYKGYGLGLAIDILSGVLSGTTSSAERSSRDRARGDATGRGHFILAIRLRAFSPWIKFRNTMKEKIQRLSKAAARGAPRIYYPGEIEFEIDQERRASGIPLDKGAQSELEGLSRSLDIHDAWEHLVEGRK